MALPPVVASQRQQPLSLLFSAVLEDLSRLNLPASELDCDPAKRLRVRCAAQAACIVHAQRGMQRTSTRVHILNPLPVRIKARTSYYLQVQDTTLYPRLWFILRYKIASNVYSCTCVQFYSTQVSYRYIRIQCLYKD